MWLSGGMFWGGTNEKENFMPRILREQVTRGMM
jgi:hypothetical protein